MVRWKYHYYDSSKIKEEGGGVSIIAHSYFASPRGGDKETREEGEPHKKILQFYVMSLRGRIERGNPLSSKLSKILSIVKSTRLHPIKWRFDLITSQPFYHPSHWRTVKPLMHSSYSTTSTKQTISLHGAILRATWKNDPLTLTKAFLQRLARFTRLGPNAGENPRNFGIFNT